MACKFSHLISVLILAKFSTDNARYTKFLKLTDVARKFSHLIGVLKLAKNKFKILVNRILTIHLPHHLILKF